jgi:hypothetical protein
MDNGEALIWQRRSLFSVTAGADTWTRIKINWHFRLPDLGQSFRPSLPDSQLQNGGNIEYSSAFVILILRLPVLRYGSKESNLNLSAWSAIFF